MRLFLACPSDFGAADKDEGWWDMPMHGKMVLCTKEKKN